MKKLISILLSVVMLTTIMSVCSFNSYAELSADNNYEYRVNSDGTLTVTDYKGSEFDVVVPETIDGKSVTAIQNAFDYVASYEYFTGEHMSKVNIRKIRIPKTVKAISFRGGYSLPMLNYIEVDKDNPYFSSENGVLFNKNKTVLLRFPAARRDTYYSIPKSVKKINDYAFENAKYLSTVKIGKGVTDIGIDAFFNCVFIKKIYIPKNVKNMKHCGLGLKAYYNCWTHPDDYPEAEDVYERYRETIPDFKIYGKKGSAGEKYCQSRRNYFSYNLSDSFYDEIRDTSFEDLTFVAVPLKNRPALKVKVKKNKVYIIMNNYVKENQESYFSCCYKISAKKGKKEYLFSGYTDMRFHGTPRNINPKTKNGKLIYKAELPKGKYKIRYRAVYYVSNHKIKTKWSKTKTVVIK